MKYGHKTLNWFEAIVNKLGGEEAAEMFLRGVTSHHVASWKTIKIGVYKNLDAMATKMLTEFKVSDWVKAALGKSTTFTLAQVEEDVDIAVATVKQLTGKDRATTKEVFDTIKCVGDLVPAEVGPALREQYLDQPIGEKLYLAMEPIKEGSGTEVYVFGVCSGESGLWLNVRCANPDGVWLGDIRMAFLCARRAA